MSLLPTFQIILRAQSLERSRGGRKSEGLKVEGRKSRSSFLIRVKKPVFDPFDRQLSTLFSSRFDIALATQSD